MMRLGETPCVRCDFAVSLAGVAKNDLFEVKELMSEQYRAELSVFLSVKG